MIAEAAEMFDLNAQPLEHVDCNLCGIPNGMPEYHAYQHDRYGYNVGVTHCCGLVYLNPRMTAEAYRRFYESGAYRRLVSAYHGREINAETIQAEQEDYAQALALWLQPHLPAPGHGRLLKILDVGGSTGVVARFLGDCYQMFPEVLDPSTSEIEKAAELPCMEVIQGTAESFDPVDRKWDLITICQTIDHLLDPMGVLKKLRGCLSDGGLLFVDVVDYNVTKEIKIDHPYNFTEATMAEMLKRAGFKVIAHDRAADGVHLRYLCERSL